MCPGGRDAKRLPPSSYSLEACLLLKILNKIPIRKRMIQTAIPLMIPVTRVPDSEGSKIARASESP